MNVYQLRKYSNRERNILQFDLRFFFLVFICDDSRTKGKERGSRHQIVHTIKGRLNDTSCKTVYKTVTYCL